MVLNQNGPPIKKRPEECYSGEIYSQKEQQSTHVLLCYVLCVMISATPVFLPGESHGQRSLVDYGPWGHKESDMTEVT